MTSDKLGRFIERSGLAPESMDAELFVERFICEMDKGTRGEKSSLGMIPTYISCEGSLPEEGYCIAIDAGGTNFRAALVRFDKSGAYIEKLENYPMPGSLAPVSWQEFISFAAESIRPYLQLTKKIAICISFPTKITSECDGIIVYPTKEVDIRGYEGRLICQDLLAELRCAGASAVVLNDTTAVLLSALTAGADKNGLIGIINGTGTNICCQLESDGLAVSGKMIYAVESGGFEPPQRSEIDIQLDSHTARPGVYQEEKLVSGAYLGEICRRAFLQAAQEGLFVGEDARILNSIDRLPTPVADGIINGENHFEFSAQESYNAAQEIAKAVFSRAAKHIACTLCAALAFCKEESHCITVSADGSVFRKSRFFRQELDKYVAELLPGREIRFVSMDSSTAIGTAVAAALG